MGRTRSKAPAPGAIHYLSNLTIGYMVSRGLAKMASREQDNNRFDAGSRNEQVPGRDQVGLTRLVDPGRVRVLPPTEWERLSGLTTRQGVATGMVVVRQTTAGSGNEAGRGSDRWMPTKVPGVSEVFTGSVALCRIVFAYGRARPAGDRHARARPRGREGHYTSQYLGHLQVRFPSAQPGD